MILFAGNCHGEFAQIGHAVCCARPSAVVLLGDLELERPLHEELADVAQLTDIWWIPGNHEFDDEASYANVFDSELKFRNLDCRVVEVAGYRVAGLGGVFHGKVWDPARTPKPLFGTRSAYLAQMGKGNAWRGGLPGSLCGGGVRSGLRI